MLCSSKAKIRNATLSVFTKEITRVHLGTPLEIMMTRMHVRPNIVTAVDKMKIADSEKQANEGTQNNSLDPERYGWATLNINSGLIAYTGMARALDKSAIPLRAVHDCMHLV